MAKETTKSALMTPDLFARKRGRPSTGKAMTGAQRIKKMRSERLAAGLCPCCGQVLLARSA